ncbi:MAG: RNA polymerase sigma factor [Candidatus Kapaibacteriota bacterium]|jgi:RNA polymerase sigma-70 factor (ECF subfamily)
MNTPNENVLKSALNKDINAFQTLFAEFQPQLKSYLYRLLADRNDADDLTHDTFIKAFDNIASFKGESSLKTWVFQIATNLAYNILNKRQRWQSDVMQRGKNLAMSESEVFDTILRVSKTATDTRYDMKEHIDTCFTCIAKTLPPEQQIALMLKDVYDFSVNEVSTIMETSVGVVKHLLIDARKTMVEIFDNRCSLVSKTGTCHQCSELNGVFNPKQNQQEELLKLDLVKGSKKFNREELLTLRTTLLQAVDPLRSEGANLQEILLRCNRVAVGELEKSAFSQN